MKQYTITHSVKDLINEDGDHADATDPFALTYGHVRRASEGTPGHSYYDDTKRYLASKWSSSWNHLTPQIYPFTIRPESVYASALVRNNAIFLSVFLPLLGNPKYPFTAHQMDSILLYSPITAYLREVRTSEPPTRINFDDGADKSKWLQQASMYWNFHLLGEGRAIKHQSDPIIDRSVSITEQMDQSINEDDWTYSENLCNYIEYILSIADMRKSLSSLTDEDVDEAIAEIKQSDRDNIPIHFKLLLENNADNQAEYKMALVNLEQVIPEWRSMDMRNIVRCLYSARFNVPMDWVTNDITDAIINGDGDMDWKTDLSNNRHDITLDDLENETAAIFHNQSNLDRYTWHRTLAGRCK